VERVQDTEQFHDSESDVYDLFNACNGVLDVNGLIDVEQLNHYSPDEAEEMNVSRLRVVWEHTATGCAHCAEIIESLQALRKALRQRSAGRSPATDINDINSTS
jgi:hypothetical protein